MLGISGSDGDCCGSTSGGSGVLDEYAMDPVGGFPVTEGTLGSDGGSDGGSDCRFDEGSTGGLSVFFGEGVGLPECPVLTGAAGSLGRDAGLAATAEGVGRSGTVVGSAGAGAGAGVGLATGLGRSKAAGVNAIGGSKRAKVLNPSGLLNIPVHKAAHIGLRENIFIGGTISGSHGGPIVVTTEPSADVLSPKPHVGQARS